MGTEEIRNPFLEGGKYNLSRYGIEKGKVRRVGRMKITTIYILLTSIHLILELMYITKWVTSSGFLSIVSTTLVYGSFFCDKETPSPFSFLSCFKIRVVSRYNQQSTRLRNNINTSFITLARKKGAF